MKTRVWFFAMLLVFVQICQAQAPAKTPAAETLAKGWLDAFNSGDGATLLAFLQKYRPEDTAHIDGLLNFRSRTGGFDVEKIEESTATHCAALVKEKDSDQFARLAVDVDPEAPNKIVKFELQAVPRPAEFAIPRLTEKEAVEALGKELEHETAGDRFSGAALVAQNGKIIFEQACGESNRDKKIPNKLDTQFRLGSMNKMFTAVSVLQLVQAGKIQLA